MTVPFAVAADGMWSPVRKALGCSDEPGYLGEWHAFRQYFTGVGPAATGQLWVWFEQDLLPGYAWSFALPGGVANVGFGIHRRSGSPTSEMKSLWLDLLERPHIRSVLGPMCRSEAPHKAWPIPARIGGTELVAAGGRVLFVGDAARAPDSMTGEGIGQALETGQLAAEAISRASPRTPDLVGRFYRRSVKAGLARRRQDRPGAVTASSATQEVLVARCGLAGRHRLDQAQLRPLDVRGLSQGDPGHAPPVARRDAARPGCLRSDGTTDPAPRPAPVAAATTDRAPAQATAGAAGWTDPGAGPGEPRRP